MRALPVKVLIFLAILTTVTVSCVYTWKGIPRNIEKREVCDPTNAFPQMIQIPIFTSTWQVVHSCDVYPSEPVAIAMTIFYLEWHRTFGDPNAKVWNALNKVMIDWSPLSKKGIAYDITGNRLNSASYGGLALSKSYVWVKPHPDEIICESALIHELVHISIWAIKGTDGDPDHMGNIYSGWTVDHSALIQRVNDSLCTLGI